MIDYEERGKAELNENVVEAIKNIYMIIYM